MINSNSLFRKIFENFVFKLCNNCLCSIFLRIWLIIRSHERLILNQASFNCAFGINIICCFFSSLFSIFKIIQYLIVIGSVPFPWVWFIYSCYPEFRAVQGIKRGSWCLFYASIWSFVLSIILNEILSEIKLLHELIFSWIF